MPNNEQWSALKTHFREISSLHMRDLFENDSGRFQNFSASCGDLLLDYSKNRITKETLSLLNDYARSCDLEQWRDRMFNGDEINETENRAVLHTALRRPSTDCVYVDGEDIIPAIHDTLDKMKNFSDAVRSGRWTGFSGQKVTDVVNVGIGGSDLGPRMVCSALHAYKSDVNVHFVANVDGADICATLQDLDPETTLFLVASKTFTTRETLANANSAKAWLLDHYKDPRAIERHFAALSTNRDAVEEFGISGDNIFPFSDWVGGRYSLWSAIGLSICMAVGFNNFRDLLAGAHEMDRHFQTVPLEKNLPVIMANLGVWNRNFHKFGAHAVIPYDEMLGRFPAYLQQADMESNGKYVDRDGKAVTYETGPVIFGEPGTNSQHSFFQLIHQGTDVIPCDFILPKESLYLAQSEDQHKILSANCLAQSRALMIGREGENVATQKTFKGNRPSNTILLDRITPHSLGMLIALYEHKIFVQGILWNVNSYDQFGVELGKVLAKEIEPALDQDSTLHFDASTNGLLGYLKAAS